MKKQNVFLPVEASSVNTTKRVSIFFGRNLSGLPSPFKRLADRFAGSTSEDSIIPVRTGSRLIQRKIKKRYSASFLGKARKKFSLGLACLVLLGCCAFTAPMSAHAAAGGNNTITHNSGSGQPASTDNKGRANSIVPSNQGGTNSGNTVNVTGGGQVSGNVHGGISADTTTGVGDHQVSGTTVTDNVVKIDDTTVVIGGDVHGGTSTDSGHVTDNEVNITDGTIGGNVTGGNTVDSDATLNIVNIDGGTIGDAGDANKGDVSGGLSDGGHATDNIVNVGNGTVNGNVHGGKSVGTTTGNASNNQVNFTNSGGNGNGTVNGNVHGGSNVGGNVSNNQVNVGIDPTSSNTAGWQGTVTGEVHGGSSSGDGQVSGNKVNITDGNVQGNVHGGSSSGGNSHVQSNEVNISGGTVGLDQTNKGDVHGGSSASDGNVSDNHVNIDNGTVNGNVHGGSSSGGNSEVAGNHVNITGGTIGVVGDVTQGDVHGGSSHNTSDGDVKNNTVSLDNATVNGNVHGGFNTGGNSHVQGNKVNITSGTIGSNTDPAQGHVYGGYNAGSGNADENKVDISSGDVFGHVHGGKSDVSGNADKNEIKISGGTIGSNTDPDQGHVYGGYNTGSGNADENKVDISTGDVFGHVHGGKSDVSGNADKNEIKISGGHIGSNTDPNQGHVYGGYSTGPGNANENKVDVSDGDVFGHVHGGKSDVSGNADKNEIKISGGHIGSDTDPEQGHIYGGYNTGPGNADDNKVEVSGGDVFGHVHGGKSEGNGNADKNIVHVSGGHVGVLNDDEQGDVHGGWTQGGKAERNEVHVTDNTSIHGNVHGGKSDDCGEINFNKVNIKHGQVDGDVHGGWSQSGNVGGNKVTFGDGSWNNDDDGSGRPTDDVGGHVRGGYSDSGKVHDNTVDVNVPGYTQTGHVHGGYSESGEVSGNTLNLHDGIMNGQVRGGSGSDGGNNRVSNNNLNMKGGKVNGDAHGGWTNRGEASGNSASISGGQLAGNLHGGHSEGGNASGNSASVSGGGNVAGHAYGGWTQSGSANNNKMNFSGGNVGGEIHGGHSESGGANSNRVDYSGGNYSGKIYGGWSQNSDASNNEVHFSGGNFSGDVYAGRAGNGVASRNSVHINGGSSLDMSNARIHGSDGGGSDNWLHTTASRDRTPTCVKSIDGFDHYNFNLHHAHNGDTIIHVDETVNITNTTTNIFNNTVINNEFFFLNSGDQIILIDNIESDGEYHQQVEIHDGLTTYIFEIDADGAHLVSTYTESSITPTSKSLLEGQVGSIAFLAQGTDMIMNQGIKSALASVNTSEGGLSGFGAVAGGWSRYKTGSHVDVDGVNMLVGLGWGNRTNSGALTLGVFFEAGWGNYSAYNSFTSYGAVNSDGNVDYYGGGVLARYDFPVGVYVEASGRLGSVSHNFRSSDMDRIIGENVSYDVNAMYGGLAAGLGYIWQFNEKANLDVYTKYMWTHEESVNKRVAGTDVKFDAVDSQRWRTGARMAYNVTENIAPYVGAAFEYEFDGTGKANAGNFDLGDRSSSEPTLKGGSGIGELGVTFKPMPESGFSVDLGVQGYVGRREGVTGSLQLKYEF